MSPRRVAAEAWCDAPAGRLPSCPAGPGAPSAEPVRTASSNAPTAPRSGWPGHLVELASRPPVDPEVVVAGSTPVVAFGDPRPARVVTLGLNPSTRQFLHQNGSLRTGPDRRLATLPWLGLDSWDELDPAAAGAVLSECAAYFSPGRVPYRRWFDPFDRVLAEGAGASYYDGTACHLNLVVWATDPVFRGLARSSWRRLLESDLPYVVEQLRTGRHLLVVVNGRTAMEEVAAAGLVEWTTVGEVEGPPRARLCLGESASALYAGWTCNLQNQPGAARLAGALARWLRSLGIARETGPRGR